MKRSVPIPAMQERLLAWFDHNKRTLPWRGTSDPYRIWVSEIMLQQTRVAAVLGHYSGFLKKFPSVKKLAAAKESVVLTAWSGLGYYRRARNMRLAAQMIMREHGGKFPNTAEDLRALPGIGRYTAAAIASIAFDEPVAVLDGNVERVLLRVSGKKQSLKQLWDAAEQWLASSRPGDFNQAMMELGALVCTPKTPVCASCPLFRWCKTRGEQATGKKKIRKRKELALALVQHVNSIKLVQRPKDASLMAGMWELPLAVGAGEVVLQTKHSITSTDFTVTVVRKNSSSFGRWVAIKQLNAIPLTGLARKILRSSGLLH